MTMAEYIEREELLEKMKNWHEKISLVACVNSMPAADVVPVVRCKDCKRFENVEYYPDGSKNICRLFHRQMQDNDFCSYGERKDGDTT